MTNHTTQELTFNQYQRTAAENYAGGDFAWILDHPDWRAKVEDCGDTFFTFLMLEFSDLEYPTDKADALQRLQRVADDVEELYDIIDALQQPADRIIATFVPQVCINDHAVTVDPPGETCIDITAAVLAMTRAEALDLRDDTDQTDALLDRDSAPAWIRDWTGPFYLAVEAAVARHFGTMTNPTGEPNVAAAPAE
jgi:hypothetical protein